MKDKLINILFFFSLTLLLVSLFSQKPQQVVQSDPYMTVSSKDLVVPNFPKIYLHNPAQKDISFDVCKDFAIYQNFATAPVPLPKNFCKLLTIPASGSGILSLHELHQIFEYPSTTVFKAQFGSGREAVVPIVLESPGFFRSLLSTIFYAPVLNFFIALLTYLPEHSLGFGIIIITVIVRLILLYPQHTMLINAKRMQNIAPKIKELQTRYKNDQLQLGQALMKLYKDEKVSPIGSIVPLLIQLPLLLVLYWVISSLQDTSNRYFLYSFFQDFNLQAIGHVFYGIDLYGIGGIVGIFLGLIVGSLQWLQLYLSYRALPKKEGGMSISKTLEEAKNSDTPPSLMPDQATMQKMMMFVFPPMIAVTTYIFPVGLGLYMIVSTLFVIVQQQIVQTRK